MRVPRAPHRWNLSVEQAGRRQLALAQDILEEPLLRSVRYVAGGDAAFTPDGSSVIAAWVVWDLRQRTIIERRHVIRPVRFPYVPGLLSFREAPALLAAARRLRAEPDVFLCDGHGRAHPRRFGLACHVGLILDRPTLGCAKSLLCGRHDPLPDRPDAAAPLVLDGETVGMALRTRCGARPVYVSVGHRLTLADAVSLVRLCGAGYRLPEPARLAHQTVTGLRADRP